jgi:preprotein translocase subunit Sec63
MNVHRWRVLESSDPNRFEKITLIQTLQKQLVVKADEVTRHELLIKEKEKVYMELKNIITRQPGPEIEEHILTYQQTLKDKVSSVLE